MLRLSSPSPSNEVAGNAQPAARLHLAVLRERFLSSHVLDHVMGVVEHGMPEVRRGEFARRAPEELLPQLCFQRRDPARQRRLGEAEAISSSREASLVHRPREVDEIVRLDVHGRGPLELTCSTPLRASYIVA